MQTEAQLLFYDAPHLTSTYIYPAPKPDLEKTESAKPGEQRHVLRYLSQNKEKNTMAAVVFQPCNGWVVLWLQWLIEEPPPFWPKKKVQQYLLPIEASAQPTSINLNMSRQQQTNSKMPSGLSFKLEM